MDACIDRYGQTTQTTFYSMLMKIKINYSFQLACLIYSVFEKLTTG